MRNVIFTAAMLLAANLSEAARDPRRTYTMEVTTQRTGSRTVLHVKLHNESDRPLTLNVSELPWGNSESMTVVITTPSGRRALNESPVIDDAVIGNTTIPANGVLAGDIDISGRFPELERELRSGPLYVFWSYELVISPNKTLGRKFGGLAIQARN